MLIYWFTFSSFLGNSSDRFVYQLIVLTRRMIHVSLTNLITRENSRTQVKGAGGGRTGGGRKERNFAKLERALGSVTTCECSSVNTFRLVPIQYKVKGGRWVFLELTAPFEKSLPRHKKRTHTSATGIHTASHLQTSAFRISIDDRNIHDNPPLLRIREKTHTTKAANALPRFMPFFRDIILFSSW